MFLALLAPNLVGCWSRPEPTADQRQVSKGPREIKAAFATQPVGTDPDDPAIWVHPTDGAQSLILGTDKTEAPAGGIYVFNLEGKIVQHIKGLNRPNNIDVEYGLETPTGFIDIAVATERLNHRLLIYAFDPQSGELKDITGKTEVFQGQTGEAREPMGIGLYKRPSDRKIFAIVGRKTGPAEGYLWQYELVYNAQGKVDLKKVREFGKYSQKKEIESISVDSMLGYVYYSDEGFGVHKYNADPDHPEAKRELGTLATSGWKGDHEGIALYAMDNGYGYLIVTDQLPGDSRFRVFKREGEKGRPNDHKTLLAEFGGKSDETDGIEVTSAGLGPRFPNGILVAMNSKDKNFLVFRWEDIAEGVEPPLKVGAHQPIGEEN